MTHFTKAIVKRPAKTISEGLTSADLGKPIYDIACKQHDAYIKALETCGLNVTVLEADDNFPDSCFVEDTALITRKGAIITHPGAESRKGEIDDIKECLSQFFETMEQIRQPGTIEAGDIMMVDDHFYIGLSERTNADGANQMISILEKFGLSGSTVEMDEMLHLKTGLSYLENNCLVVTGEFTNNPVFTTFDKIIVPEPEQYAANCIWINGKVIIPEGYPMAQSMIKRKGFDTITLEMSEFCKIDGGLSCLSLRF